MLDIGVVILNYLAYNETIACVSDVQKQVKDNIRLKIIVVDNKSPNESFDVLKARYENNPFITVVQTQKNLGFANGNNYGYAQLLKQMPAPDFVVVSNGDIQIPSTQLFDWIREQYEKEAFAILGPAVYSIPGQFYQSPMKNNSNSLLKNYHHLWKGYLKYAYLSVVGIFKKTVKKKTAKWENALYDKRSSAYTLHGSFLVFSKAYCKAYHELFDSRTFLYGEETILKYRCEQSKQTMIYDPSFKVLHLQGASAKLNADSDIKKMKFRIKMNIKSRKVFISYLKQLKKRHAV